MKVTTRHPDHVPTFEPVEVTFTLETQAELDALGSLFNTASVTQALSAISGPTSQWGIVYQTFKDLDANIKQTFGFSRR